MRSRSAFERYAFTLAALTAATGIRYLLQPVVGANAPFALYFLTIMAIGWWVGLGPGILSVALSAAGGHYLFLRPGSTFAGSDRFGTFAFAAMGMLYVLVAEAQARAKARAEANEQLARENEKELQREMAERKRVNQALEESQARLEQRVADRTAELEKSRSQLAEAQALAHIGNWEWDMQTNFLSWSDELHRIYGLEPRTFGATYEAFLDRVHPDDRDIVHRLIENSTRDYQSFHFDHRIIRADDGMVRTLHASGQVLIDVTGKPLRMVGTGQDVTEWKAAEIRSRGLLEAAPDAMVIVNRQGEIVLVNARTEKLFGHSRAELLGRNVEMLMPERFHDRHGQHRRFYGHSPRARQMGAGLELVAVRKDGSEFPVEVGLSPIELDNELLITSVVRDITERKRAEERVRELNTELERRVAERTAELQRSNEELRQFAYIASHDLQEPLRTVSSFTQLIVKHYKGQLDPQAQEFFTFVVGGVGRMQRLIRDLLHYSRAGSVEILLTDADCEAALKQALADLKKAIDESGAEITHDPLPVIRADETRLPEIFLNLIGNAIKYRGPDPPRIHIKAKCTGKDWLFSVRDNGVGIDPQHAERVFVPFKRLHGREYPGTGIGLAICKKVVERHGGRIWLESALNRGATFYFTIPIPDLTGLNSAGL